MLCCPLAPGAPQDTAAPPSLILISIDTLRADHLSTYGYTKFRTPHIDSFAQGGTLFTQAEAQIPLTLPSHTSLFTSTYPFENGAEENGERVPAGVVTLASVLQSRGYKTAAFIGSDFLDRGYGLDQGFDEYDSPFGPAGGEAGARPAPTTLRRDGALVVRAARLWLDAHHSQPVFVFVHLFDLHVPYTLPPEVAQKQGISRYDAQLEYVDQVMGRFQAYMKQSGWWDKSLVVIFGDHGEGLGDHRETDHGYYIYESTLHVPLIFHWPGKDRNSKLETGNSKSETGSSTRVSSFQFRVSSSSPVGLIDVAPTILDYLRVPAPPSFEGASQLGALKSQESARPGAVYSESLYAHDAFGWAPLRALHVGKYKYIQAPKAELYDLHNDPGEHLNLLPRNGAMAAEFESELAALLTRYSPQSHATPSALSPETLAQLESLGYLAAEPRRDGVDAHDDVGARHGVPLPPDPKDRIAEFERYQNAYVDFTEGHTAAALAKFQSILKSDSQNTLARFHLGECYFQLKQPQDALREWTTTLKFDPQYAPAAESIGEYWLAQGDYAKARLRFQQVVALTPESFTGHLLLGIAAARLGLVQESSEHMQIACKIAPHDDACTRKQGPMGGPPSRKKLY
jgi:arylsulfatase A-like enzyme/Tfp pilus assembly protein PilF